MRSNLLHAKKGNFRVRHRILVFGYYCLTERGFGLFPIIRSCNSAEVAELVQISALPSLPPDSLFKTNPLIQLPVVGHSLIFSNMYLISISGIAGSHGPDSLIQIISI